MTNPILTCPACGQKHRVPPNPPPNAAWKCGKCGKPLPRLEMTERPEPVAASPAPSASAPQAPKPNPAPPSPDQSQTPPPASGQAPAPSRETRLEFSWPLALKNISIRLGIAGVGVAMAVLGESTGWVIGGGILVLIGFIALGVMLSEGLGGVGSCPVCSAEIVAGSSSEPCKLCPGCREYLTIEKGVVRQIDPAAIAATPVFAVPTPWEDLKAVTYTPAGTLTTAAEERPLHANWPDACCVCGEPATRLEDRAFLIYKWNGDLVRINQTQITLRIEGIPHCDVHSKGIALDQINFRPRGDDDLKQDLALLFRSYAYRNKFLALNPWPWR